MPMTESEEDRRTNVLIDRDDPRCKKSMTDMADPNRA
jgi:hypothetical protein